MRGHWSTILAKTIDLPVSERPLPQGSKRQRNTPDSLLWPPTAQAHACGYALLHAPTTQKGQRGKEHSRKIQLHEMWGALIKFLLPPAVAMKSIKTAVLGFESRTKRNTAVSLYNPIQPREAIPGAPVKTMYTCQASTSSASHGSAPPCVVRHCG